MRITYGKGVHYIFDNGVTVSVQIGGGNYCNNYGFPIGPITRDNPLPSSNTAEIAIWPESKEWANLNSPNENYENGVAGHVPIDEVIDILATCKAITAPASKSDIETALLDWRKSNDG